MLRAFFLFQLIPRSIIIIQLSIVLTMNSFLKIFPALKASKQCHSVQRFLRGLLLRCQITPKLFQRFGIQMDMILCQFYRHLLEIGCHRIINRCFMAKLLHQTLNTIAHLNKTKLYMCKSTKRLDNRVKSH